MNLLQKKTVQFFNYYSTYDTDDLDSDNKHSVIRLYGITTNNENVYIRIDNFPLFVYLELPNNIEWNKKNITILKDYFSNTVRSSNFKPTYQYFEKKKKLYDFQMGYNGNKYSDILYPFLFMCFKSDHAIKYFSAIVKKTITIPSLGKNLQFNMCLNERFNDPLLKFFSSRNLPTIGWIEAKGIVPPKEDIESSFPIELTCDYENIKRSDCKKTIFPKILTFDIETYSHNKNSMPDVNHPKDVVFQISYVINNPLNDKIKKVLLTLGKSNPITLDKEDGGDSVEIIECKSEKELILKFSKQVKLENPNILCGYNIFGYDLNYLYKRAKYANIGRDFCNIGCISKDCTMKDFIMSSGAFGKNEMSLIDGLEGIIQIDLLPYVRRKYKLSTYTLENVAMTYLGTGKDPFKHHDIFAAYEAMTPESIQKCGHYCTVDSLRTYQLFQKMTVWFDLCESAEIQNVGIMVLFTQGTQICMYSQVLRYCLNNNFVYQPNPHNDSVVHITGATVLDPIPGLYDNIFSFDFCLTGDTLVSLSNGCSRRLDKMVKNELVLGCDEIMTEREDSDKKLNNYMFVNGLQVKGKKETVKVWLQDGTVITSTPDHKFMLENGEYCRADELKDKYVTCGIEYTEDKICEKENNWKLKLGDDVDLKMDTYENREKSLAFARMLGYILTDGSIYISSEHNRMRKCVEVYMGTMIDAINFKSDLMKFTNVDFNIRKRDRGIKGTTYCFSLPQTTSNMFHNIEGIVVGKRSTQAMKLPDFLLKENCPLSIIREFLGGLFGGDGTAPYLTKTNKFGSIAFKWTTIEKYKDNMKEVFTNLILLLSKLKIESNIISPIKIKYGENSVIKPKDYEENPRWDYQLHISETDSLHFQNNIGFRYCVNKSSRLSIVSSYQKMCEKTREQHSNVFKLTEKFVIEDKSKTKDALEKARMLVFNESPAISDCALSSVKDVLYRRHEEIRHADKPKKLSLSSKKFIQPKQYLEETKTMNWFNIGNGKKYTVSGDDINIPTFRKKVIDVRKSELVDVYDIEVDKSHNFLANGVVVHNCSLYPSIIISHNICFSTYVTDPDIPNDHCHCIDFDEHINCEHDDKKKKTVRVSKVPAKPKPITCGSYHFRFIKEEYGGKGIIPSLIVHLLDSRKNVRNEMKLLEKELKTENIMDERKKEIKLLLDVMECRQLSYKVSANSMYGALGASVGYLPFFQGAMSITYIGRKSLKKVVEYVPSIYPGTKVVYGDSCADYTPILIRKKTSEKYIEEYIEIKDLVDEDKYYEYNGKQISVIKNTDVWSDNGWTPIKFIIRHAINKQMYRVNTFNSFVDVTEDHSMILKNGEEIPPQYTLHKELLINNHPTIQFNSNYTPLFTTQLECAKSISYYNNYGKTLVGIADNNPQILDNNIDINENMCNKVLPISYNGKFVYDLETENHHFSAGVGKLVIHNTDSVFLRFPQLEGKNNKESFDFCYKLSEELKKLFLSPMKMEFEGKKYSKFLILRKKMYCLIVEDINGIQGETKSKGLITSRRDNCSLARNIFKNLVTVMMNELIPTNGKNIKDTNKNTIDRILYIINNDILSVFNKFNLNTSKPLDFKDLIIVKTIKNNIENYKAKTLPAHVQLAKKLKERGIDVPVNTRIEYLFINCEDEKALQGKRIEELEYYESHKSDYKIDFLYYIEKQLIMPLDRVLKVACGIDNYVFDLWRYHTMKYNINKKIEEIFDPFTIIDADSKKKISMMKKLKRKKVIKV